MSQNTMPASEPPAWSTGVPGSWGTWTETGAVAWVRVTVDPGGRP